MKTKILTLSLITALVTVLVFSCKKSGSENNSNDDRYTAEASTQSDDQAQFSAGMDAMADDATAALELGASAISGRVDTTLQTVCNATLTIDTASDPRTLSIVYSGNDCFGYYSRTGTVVLSIPKGKKWKDAGTAVTATYQNLVIKRLVDNSSITISGSHVITNVNGGLLASLFFHPTDSMVHTITSNGITVKFGDGTQRSWQVARRRVVRYNNGYSVSVTGTHSDGANDNIAEWGINRFGHAFTSAITSPLVISQDCHFRMVSGEIHHHSDFIDATLTFGLNADGNPTSCPNQATPYYFKLIWTGPAGNPHTIIYPYY